MAPANSTVPGHPNSVESLTERLVSHNPHVYRLFHNLLDSLEPIRPFPQPRPGYSDIDDIEEPKYIPLPSLFPDSPPPETCLIRAALTREVNTRFGDRERPAQLWRKMDDPDACGPPQRLLQAKAEEWLDESRLPQYLLGIAEDEEDLLMLDPWGEWEIKPGKTFTDASSDFGLWNLTFQTEGETIFMLWPPLPEGSEPAGFIVEQLLTTEATESGVFTADKNTLTDFLSSAPWSTSTSSPFIATTNSAQALLIPPGWIYASWTLSASYTCVRLFAPPSDTCVHAMLDMTLHCWEAAIVEFATVEGLDEREKKGIHCGLQMNTSLLMGLLAEVVDSEDLWDEEIESKARRVVEFVRTAGSEECRRDTEQRSAGLPVRLTSAPAA